MSEDMVDRGTDRPRPRVGRRRAHALLVGALVLGFGVVPFDAPLLSPALAQESSTTDEVSDWVHQCVRSLDAEDADVARGAHLALVELGPRALPDLISASDLIRTPAGERWLGAAVAKLPLDQTVRFLSSDTTEFPEKRRLFWDLLLTELKHKQAEDADPTDEQPAADPADGIGDVDPDLAAAVDEILEGTEHLRSWSSSSPQVRRLVLLGKRALPALVAEFLRLGASSGARSGFVRNAIELLVDKSHAPLMVRGIRLGGVELAPALIRTGDGELIEETVSDLLRKGVIDFTIAEALTKYEMGPQVRDALHHFFVERANWSHYGCGAAARALLASGHPEAEQALLTALERTVEFQGQQDLASQLAERGHVEGLHALVKCLGDCVRKDLIWSGHDAGTDLNRLTGQDFYVRSGTGDFNEPHGNFEEAAKRYAEWMEKHSRKLKFDERTARWRVR